ncbi:hypothetical protein C7120_10655 [Prevotella sp. oral taxon 376]|nr:hypothetical protein C7120_10655 [Prevotella sp. oral taxon 376]
MGLPIGNPILYIHAPGIYNQITKMMMAEAMTHKAVNDIFAIIFLRFWEARVFSLVFSIRL